MQSKPPMLAESPSHQIAQTRFSRPSVAEVYPSEYGDNWRHRREKACILECVSHIPAGGKILDIPCGTARMTKLLVERGYRVTGADISDAMLARAIENYATYQSERNGNAPAVRFAVQDVLSTNFANDEFDGICCIRLFHHFAEADIRRRALCELRRICRGPIIVSFLNSFALDRFAYWIKALIKRRSPLHQLPIAFNTFAADVAASGLHIDRHVAAHWGISSRWFLVLNRAII
jgi:ubiquinone/menaquinone biosynthesis C-methylase UbiE